MAPKIAQDQQRPRVAAPHVPLSILRKKMRLTLDAVCDGIGQETGVRPDRSALSAIENGAAIQMIEALARVYDIPVAVVDIDYVPRDAQAAVPHVPISVLRKKMGLTLDAVCDRIGEETGMQTGMPTLSAIENGHRGASLQMIEAFALVYDIPVHAIDIGYVPRNRQRAVS